MRSTTPPLAPSWAALFAAALIPLGCGPSDVPTVFAAPSGTVAGRVEIHVPEKLTSIETEARDPLGRPVRIACATCHSARGPAVLPRDARDLRAFHQGLEVSHGQLGCDSCHLPPDGQPPALHLANGARVPMVEAMSLCAQCHGPQHRDYQNGAHGGMSGSWDLSRGSRLRNHCVDCHDPHVPKIPLVTPAPRARDRDPIGDAHERRNAGG